MLLGSTVVVVWALYLAYMPYEAWWFLRFMLPSWPAICLGMAVVIVRLGQTRYIALRVAAFGLAVAVGAYALRFAVNNGAFPSGEGDHRYVSVAKIVEPATEPTAVIFAGQHSGPTRYYAGRTIIRYELIDPAWLDRAVQWLNAAGRRPYFPARRIRSAGVGEAICLNEYPRPADAGAHRRLSSARHTRRDLPVRPGTTQRRRAHHHAAARSSRGMRPAIAFATLAMIR